MNNVDRIKLEVFVALACDADYQRLAGNHNHGAPSSNLTIAQALEVLDD